MYESNNLIFLNKPEKKNVLLLIIHKNDIRNKKEEKRI